ncbi:hypothetical protein C1H46_023914 [Malus baccata]|uniref:Uncharacterized protein n=1 Tax=Malus baccata TaxID=106549 RepID=A0A540LVS3_MALBA|nr:hypothetical protein C1H46_023914 [Malus baccata]
MRFEGQQSKDIAKDCLEGALDREGSLVMLSKLHRKLQKLKKVIRDSFVRKKLAENTESVKKATTADLQKARERVESGCQAHGSRRVPLETFAGRSEETVLRKVRKLFQVNISATNNCANHNLETLISEM